LIRTAVQYYISLHHTRIADIHHLLTELEANSEFGDISRFSLRGRDLPGAPAPVNPPPLDPTIIDTDPFQSSDTPAREGTHPGIFLINLAVLAAATRLRVDQWNETQGYIQFIALHYWHPSFGIDFPSFLHLVHTELRDSVIQTEDSGSNPFDIQVGPNLDPSDTP
jgi:hypothetical protein